MANSVVAGSAGHDYQARFFWILASSLRDPQQPHVSLVTYEADEPRSFDDVVVHYDPPRPGRGSHRISVVYHQIKYHVTDAGRFGYQDLVNPKFVGATTISLLQRLADAKKKAPANSEFVLVTTDRIADGDPLGELVSSDNHLIRFDKLGQGGPNSRMGKVRKLWRDHVGLKTDDELKDLLDGFRIQHGSSSLEHLRDQVNVHFQLVGLCGCHETLEFRFDATARSLKATGRNELTRDGFEALCREERWIVETSGPEFTRVAVRSFADGPTSSVDAAPENTLSLLDLFESRHLRAGANWTTQVQPAIDSFLAGVRAKTQHVRLFLDAHLSIAFLAGTRLGFKSGVAVELVQKGRAGTAIWKADDGIEGPAPHLDWITRGEGPDTAVVVSYSRDALKDVVRYLDISQPQVGRVLHAYPPDPPGPRSVQGGAHAAAIVDAVASAVREQRSPGKGAVHVFLAAPNAMAFWLGQHREAMGPCVLYEFDFSQIIDNSYHPSFCIG